MVPAENKAKRLSTIPQKQFIIIIIIIIIKIHIHVVPLFGPFWSVKYLTFGQKLPVRTTHHDFPESRHPEVTKNPHYFLSPEGSQKKVSDHVLI